MGETGEEKKHGDSTKAEKEEKKHEEKEKQHAEDGGGEEKGKDKKKKKDKDKKEKKEKNPQDKTDPTKLKQKLEKLDVKMQALQAKREEILKLMNEAQNNAAKPSGDAPAS